METNKQVNLWGERLLQGLIVLLPTYLLRFELVGFGLNVLDILVVGAFIACIVLYRRLDLGVWQYYMGSFAVIGLLAVTVSPNTTAALGLYKSYIILPMMVGMMVLTIRPRLEVILQATAIAIAFIAGVGAWQFLTGSGIPAPWNIPGADFRITSIYEYPNAVGLILAPLLALLAVSVMQRGTYKHWFFPIVLLGGLAIIWSRSAGAVIALVAAIIFSLLFTRWHWWVIFGTSAVVVLLLAFPPTREIILLQDTSGEVRLALWQGTANLLAHHPLVGAGLAGFPDLYAQYKLDRHVELLLYPHNIFLDFWVELGLLGLIWLVVMIVRFFWRLGHTQQRSAIILMSGMVAMLVYGLVDVPYFKNDLAIVFWLLLTLADIQVRRSSAQ